MMGRWGSIFIGLLLAVIGVIWILQGIGLLPGSFMTGQAFWAIMGAIALVVGVGIIIYGARWSPKS